MALQRRELATGNSHVITVYDWQPANGSSPTAIVQILHGLGEHAGRYDRFANTCTENGLAVVAHNHRGHGNLENFGHYADADGWNKVIADVLQVRQDIATRHPGLPVILLGHSMGSYIAQSFVMRHSGNIAALILSASTLASRYQLRMGNVVAKLYSIMSGRRKTSRFLNHMGLGNLNNSFKPNRTEFDWLSRDDGEVDRYVADPLCGGPFSNQLWYDLTGGMLAITSGKSIRTVGHDLPIMILGGERDPIGGRSGLTRLANAYRRTGHDDLTLMIYPEGRHEMLNETNREAVASDIIGWIDSA